MKNSDTIQYHRTSVKQRDIEEKVFFDDWNPSEEFNFRDEDNRVAIDRVTFTRKEKDDRADETDLSLSGSTVKSSGGILWSKRIKYILLLIVIVASASAGAWWYAYEKPHIIGGYSLKDLSQGSSQKKAPPSAGEKTAVMALKPILAILESGKGNLKILSVEMTICRDCRVAVESNLGTIRGIIFKALWNNRSGDSFSNGAFGRAARTINLRLGTQAVLNVRSVRVRNI